MASIDLNGSVLGNALQTFLMLPDVKPGDDPSYEACKTVLLYHPLGQKMAEAPVKMAQSKQREIVIPGAPEERLKKAFEQEWRNLHATKHIRNAMKLARTYGIASIIFGAVGKDTNSVIDPLELYKLDLYFNVADPLNTAGSLVLNQDPNAPDFQKKMGGIRINGTVYHPSRSCTVLNEEPVYIAYTNSAFGFVGRSVFQRAWYPLKSFVNTMITDDMVARKSGVLIAKMKQPGSLVDQLMQRASGVKRSMLKEAETDNVLTIGPDDDVTSLNLQNLDGAAKLARDNILKNIATAADMPAALLDQETFARGMAEGTEDSKRIAQYIDGLREDMAPLYEFFDRICMYRAWNPEFYAALQAEFPEYRNISYTNALYSWINSFHSEWPSFLDELPHDAVKSDETRQKSIVELLTAVMPELDPLNKARLIQWAADNTNQHKAMFSVPLEFDYDAIADYEPPAPIQAPNDES